MKMSLSLGYSFPTANLVAPFSLAVCVTLAISFGITNFDHANVITTAVVACNNG